MNLENKSKTGYARERDWTRNDLEINRQLRLLVFQRLRSFLTETNIRQTTQRHSYRASNIKSRLIQQWFGYGNPVNRTVLKNSVLEDPSYIDRTVKRYLDNDRCIERHGHLYPSESLTEHMTEICIKAKTPHSWRKTSIRLNISKEILNLSVLLTERGNDPLREVSGQLIRLELTMWEQFLSQSCVNPCTTELATRSSIRQSTLTTLLDAAVRHRLLIPNRDENDERITRWALNLLHNRNKYVNAVIEENISAFV
jgi:hypothetical protein